MLRPEERHGEPAPGLPGPDPDGPDGELRAGLEAGMVRRLDLKGLRGRLYLDALSLEDCEQNLGRLAHAVPAWADLLAAVDPRKLSGRVGFRCASPDYLPLVGAVPDRDAFLHDYGELRKNARTILETRGQYMPGLFLNTGHGSRGLTSTPLAAQLLASTIAGEALPMDRTLCRALSPARFLVRDLVRGRI